MAGCFEACQAIWLNFVLKELKIEVCKPIDCSFITNLLYIWGKNPLLYGISKHIKAKSHFIKEQVNKDMLKVITLSN